MTGDWRLDRRSFSTSLCVDLHIYAYMHDRMWMYGVWSMNIRIFEYVNTKVAYTSLAHVLKIVQRMYSMYTLYTVHCVFKCTCLFCKVFDVQVLLQLVCRSLFISLNSLVFHFTSLYLCLSLSMCMCVCV